MFAIIYRAKIKEGRQKEYRECWNKIAKYFIEHRGAIGSCLHQAKGNIWIAYSRWPTQTIKDASWPSLNTTIKPNDLPNDIAVTIDQMRDCFEEEFKEECMELVDDFLQIKHL